MIPRAAAAQLVWHKMALHTTFHATIVTYLGNLQQAHATLAVFRESDWGSEPAVFVQPPHWPKGKPAASANYKRALVAAEASGADFALLLEDDVRVCCHLRHNLSTIPVVARRQADCLTLFMPDLIADPWEREEPHLGYRLAKPRYAGPNTMWERYRLWGSQAYLFSRAFVRALLERWDTLTEGQDSRVLAVCNALKVPMYYTKPCLVEHVPLVTAFGTPVAYAPDFDPDFRLTVGPGFQPPETIPGWLTDSEARCLYAHAAGRWVLELGTASGRSTVCLAQSAAHVTAVDVADQTDAAEWVRRYGLADRVTFRRGDVAEVVPTLTGPFDLIFIDTEHDAASVTRDIEASLTVLAPGGLLAFHDYPDPSWPQVRPTVDAFARELGWKRIEQAGFCGVFRTDANAPPVTVTAVEVASDADVRSWFRPRWSADERARGIELLKATGAVLAELGVGWFIYGGGLLGQVIGGGPLPWDDDLDLMTVGKVEGERLKAAAAPKGLAVVPHPQPDTWKVSFAADPVNPKGWAFLSVDLAFGEVAGGEFVHASVWGGHDRFPVADVLPLGTGPFDGIAVGLPTNPAAVCRRKYGPDCLTSALPPAWDHRTETPTGFPRVRIPLDRIHKQTGG